MGRRSVIRMTAAGIVMCGVLVAISGSAGAGAAAASGVAAVSAPAVSAGSAGVAWGTAQKLAGVPVSQGFVSPQITSLSCASPGNCAVGGGYYDQHSHQQAMLADDRNGTWTRAAEVPGTAKLNSGGHAEVQAVSCTAAGDCTAAGFYSPGGKDASGVDPSSDAFVVTETGGTWGNAIEVPGTAALNTGKSASVSAVSCWSPGNCVAAGSYSPGLVDGSVASMGFLVTETKGTWGKAEPVPGLAALNVSDNASVTSVSCPAAGACVIGGQYVGSGVIASAFVADQAGATWNSAQQVEGTDGVQQFAVSCAARGSCGADGSLYNGSTEAFVAAEAGGTWGAAHALPSQVLTAGPLSCASPGDCAIGGTYLPAASKYEAYVLTEVNGTWGGVQPVPGLAALNAGNNAGVLSMSCGSAGSCVAVGYYADKKSDYSNQGFIAAETAGKWANVQRVPGITRLDTSDLTAVSSVSCVHEGFCAAGGWYDGGGFDFVAQTLLHTAAVLSLSSAKTTYGREQSEKLSVTVTSAAPAVPFGKVTVKAGAKSVCVITVKSGRGTCALTARELGAGTYHLSAVYAATGDFTASTSAAKTLLVARA
jgi:Bacterial Ig-like domain (group 3)